jgi:hypothetical protein
MFASKDTLLTRPSGYQIQRSLRFRSSASANLSKTFSSAPTSRTTITQSAWVKLGALSNAYNIIALFGTFNNWEQISLTSPNNTNGWAGNVIRITGPGSAGELRTTQVFRDPAAWYHIVVVYDTTNATSSERIRLFINGVRVTSFSTATYPPQNQTTTEWLVSGAESNIATTGASTTQTFDGYMTEINVIDGQALTPSSFGAINPVTGVWSATKYAGTYGTNGFYLNFSDNSAATATTIGKDNSGNGNNWTPNNISVTAGSTYDSMLDAPLGAGGGERGNYCVLNPLSNTAGTWSNANLRFVGPSSTRRSNSTVAVSTDKWYWEVTLGNAPESPRGTSTGYNSFGFGLSTVFASTTGSSTQTDAVILADNGFYKNFSGAWTDGGTGFSSGDTLAVAVDLTANTFTFYRNNTQITTGTIGGTAGRELTPVIISYSGAFGVMDCNFGQRPFSYTPPTGFKALHTGNLAAPVIALPAQNMDINLWTGDGTSPRSFTNTGGFQPDFVWVKSRVGPYDHVLVDSVRGASKKIASNTTAAEVTNVNGAVSAFNSSGFSVAAGSSTILEVNNSGGATYVGWQWKAGGTAVTNTAGSITSSVSANTTAGFSVVTYTGTGANATVGHGLGVAPQMFIVKSRSAATSWNVYHVSTGNTGALFLETTNAFAADSTRWNNTTPTSTVFSLGSGAGVNASAATFVAYCFTPVAGYSAFGSYTGNGSTNGPFVFLGFRPRWVMIKRTSGAGEGWFMYDTSRNTFNYAENYLVANGSDAEIVYFDDAIDIVSNGIKVRAGGTRTAVNDSGSTYIYMAFAENPFKNSLAR